MKNITVKSVETENSKLCACPDIDTAIYILDFIKTEYEKRCQEDIGVKKYVEALQMGIDALRVQTVSNVNVYKWYAEFDNGATIENKTGIVFANDVRDVGFIVNNILCKHNDDFVSSLKIERIDILSGDAFVITDEWKNGSK